MTSQEILLAKHMYEQEGKSINYIRKQLGYSHDKVSRELKKIGVDIIKIRNQYTVGVSVNETKFNKIDNEFNAYFLGLLYADGCLREDRNDITLDLQEKDRDIVEKFHLFMENKNTINKHIIKRNNKTFISYYSQFSSKKVKQDLINLGCTPKKSLTLICPGIQQVPDSLFHHFVRGYNDGDGYIRKKYKEITICGTLKLLMGIQKRMKWPTVELRKQNNIFYLSYYGDNALNCLYDIYNNATIFMQRKYNIYQYVSQCKTP